MTSLNPVIVCIAKLEQDYIEQFVKYHLKIGFKHIYLYDNEDEPTYEAMLQAYKENLTVIHFPFNNYDKGVQYVVLDEFIKNYLFKTDITHVAHIDIDEFIVLKKHETIQDFINEYIVGDCEGIGMHWRWFGSSGKTEKTDEPLMIRFTMCEKNTDHHIKTLFKKDNFLHYNTCHDVTLSSGHIKCTNQTIIKGPFNENMNSDVIQLNHYKCKTLPEFRHIRKRQRAGLNNAKNTVEDVDANFKKFNINEVEDFTGYKLYKRYFSN